MDLPELEDQRSQIVRVLELLEEDLTEGEPDSDQLARIDLLRARLEELNRLVAEQTGQSI